MRLSPKRQFIPSLDAVFGIVLEHKQREIANLTWARRSNEQAASREAGRENIWH